MSNSAGLKSGAYTSIISLCSLIESAIVSAVIPFSIAISSTISIVSIEIPDSIALSFNYSIRSSGNSY